MKLIEIQNDGLSETRTEYKLVESGARGPAGLPPTNTAHNDTTGKQGGATDEYFHNTSDEQAGISGANNLGPTNAAATVVDLFLLAFPGGGSVTGASSSFAPYPNRLHIISDNSAADLHTLTLAAANLLGTKLYTSFVISVAPDYGVGKILRIVSAQISIDLYAGDSVLVMWLGGTTYVIEAANQNIAVARAYSNRASKDAEFPIPYAAAVAVDFANGNEQYTNATGNLEITAFDNFPDGGKLEFNMFHILGPWTLTLPASVDNAASISIAGTAGGWDTLVFRKSNGILSGFLAGSK